MIRLGTIDRYQWIAFGLVFLAVSLIAYQAISVFHAYQMEADKKRRRTYQETMMRTFVSPERLLHQSLACACGFLLLALLILFVAGVFNLYVCVPACLVAFVVGYKLPYLYHRRRLTLRQREFEDGFMDFLVSVTSGIRIGMGLSQCLSFVAGRSVGPLKEEFQLVMNEVKFGKALTEAIENLKLRVPCEDVDLFVTTIKLTHQTGGSLVEVLEQMTEMIRRRREFRDKLRTLTAQGQFEAIFISCSPVFGFAIIGMVDWNLMRPLVTTEIGWIAIGVMCVLIALGYTIISKITAVDA